MRVFWLVGPAALLGLAACVNTTQPPPPASAVVTPAPAVVTPPPAVVTPAPGTTVIQNP
jgi:hypothetical protein